MNQYYKAALMARTTTGKTLADITGLYYSAGRCVSATYNPSGTEPKDLAKSHTCWTTCYDNLDKIGEAAKMDLSSLRDGDSRGNPYLIDENEGEGGDCTRQDWMYSLRGNGVSLRRHYTLPTSGNC